MKRMLIVGVTLALALTAAGCADFAQGVSGIAQDLSTSTPAQVTTYAEATAAADLGTRTVDLVVLTGKLDTDTLSELSKLNDDVHSAWLKIKAAKDAGQSLTFAAFNAALSAYTSYRTSQGIKEAPPAPTPTQ